MSAIEQPRLWTEDHCVQDEEFQQRLRAFEKEYDTLAEERNYLLEILFSLLQQKRVEIPPLSIGAYASGRTDEIKHTIEEITFFLRIYHERFP